MLHYGMPVSSHLPPRVCSLQVILTTSRLHITVSLCAHDETLQDSLKNHHDILLSMLHLAGFAAALVRKAWGQVMRTGILTEAPCVHRCAGTSWRGTARTGIGVGTSIPAARKLPPCSHRPPMSAPPATVVAGRLAGAHSLTVVFVIIAALYPAAPQRTTRHRHALV